MMNHQKVFNSFSVNILINFVLTMNKKLLVALMIIGVVWGEVQSCTSCGSECQSACGTRHFRTCCFNYLKKKRTIKDEPLHLMDPSLRLELWLAKSRSYPYFQQEKEIFESNYRSSNQIEDQEEAQV